MMRLNRHRRGAAPRDGRRVAPPDSGSGLTEFVIVAPLFIVLILWSEVFVDTGIVRLKMEEAARYATWEMSAQRLDTEVTGEIADRFADLASPKDLRSANPSTRSFRTISMVTTINAQSAPLVGTAPPPASISAGPVAQYLFRGITGLVGGSVTSFINKLGSRWSTKREYTATVDLTVTNTLFPGGHILGVFLDAPPRDRTLTFHATAPALLVDTWKAWPGPFGYKATKPNTDPRTTFSANNTANTVEKEMSLRVGDVAFLGKVGAGSVLQIVGFVLSIVGLVNPVNTGTWDQTGNDGPIVSWPGATPLHSWSPGFLSHIQRVGDIYKDTGGYHDTTVNSNIRTPAPGVDRTRYTTPSRINTPLWGPGVGGLQLSTTLTLGGGNFLNFGPGYVPSVIEQRALNASNYNPYVALYDPQCRDGGYMGAMRLAVNRWQNDTYNQDTHTSCPGSANSVPCYQGWSCH